jgi:hypothetical protein
MKEQRISLPEIVLIAGTRVALGVGLGLLLANHPACRRSTCPEPSHSVRGQGTRNGHLMATPCILPGLIQWHW